MDTVYQRSTVPTVEEHVTPQGPTQQTPIWRPSCLFETDKNTSEDDIKAIIKLLKPNTGGLGIEHTTKRRDSTTVAATQLDTDQLSFFLLNLEIFQEISI